MRSPRSVRIPYIAPKIVVSNAESSEPAYSSQHSSNGYEATPAATSAPWYAAHQAFLVGAPHVGRERVADHERDVRHPAPPREALPVDHRDRRLDLVDGEEQVVGPEVAVHQRTGCRARREPVAGVLAEPLVERHLVGSERGAVALEEAGHDRLQSADQQLGLDRAAIGEALVGLELGRVPERRVEPDELEDGRLDLFHGAAAELVARLHGRAVFEDEREPTVVVDGGVHAARRADGHARREVPVEAQLVRVAARGHEVARGCVLGGELADDAGRRTGHITVELQVVAGADAHEPGPDRLRRRRHHVGVADPALVAQHLGEERGGDVSVGAQHRFGHGPPQAERSVASGSGIRYRVAALVLRILRRTPGSMSRSGSAARARLSG